jgi:hypothetical protein
LPAEPIGLDPGILVEERVHGSAQISDALAVHNPQARNPALPTYLDVLPNQGRHFFGVKRMQVEFAVHRKLSDAGAIRLRPPARTHPGGKG